MNKKFFTLVALLGLFVSFGASAQTTPITSGNFYFLKAGSTGDSTLVVRKSVSGKPDSLVAIAPTAEVGTPLVNAVSAAGDSALWKVEASKDANTGIYYYKITNKATGTVLSFGKSNNNGVGKDLLSGSNMTFTFGLGALAKESEGVKDFFAYVPDAAKDSVLQLGIQTPVNGIAQVNPLKYAGNTANTTNVNAKVQFVRPSARFLSATELNAKLTNGFQLFAFYGNDAVTTNNPLSGIRFEAVAANPAATDSVVYLKATSVGTKKRASDGKYYDQYALIDTASYSAADNKPTNGSRMLFKVDTVSTKVDDLKKFDAGSGTVGDTVKYIFVYDPSSAKDSVLVFASQVIAYDAANTVYKSTKATAWPTSAKFEHGKGFAGWVPVQVDPLGGTSVDKYVLTTGATDVAANAKTRIAFTGDFVPGVLDLDKVYAVKNINKAKDFKGTAAYGNVPSGKYYGVDLSNNDTALVAAYVQIPATQFVFNGTNLINRENEALNLGRIYKAGDAFTNGTDTFEVSVLDVDITDTRVGYKYFSPTDLTNKGYTFDYMSGILEGRSINTTSDSMVIAKDAAGKLFKLVSMKNAGKVVDWAFGPAAVNKDAVVQLEREAYALQTRDGKYTIALNADGQLIVTGVNSKLGATPQYFFFREIETPGQYIMLPVNAGGPRAAYGDEYSYKYNVNSTTAVLEKVAITLANNAFAINDEMAAPYVLDAKGHYTFMTPRGEGLTANANMFATYRKVGELKAEYTADDFKLYVDTAKVKGVETAPLYYILKGAEAGDNAQLQGNFLRVMVDSLAANPEVYSVTVEGKSLARLQFVPAKREVPGDSLLLNFEAEKHVKGDSIEFKGKNTGKINQFRYRIKYDAAGTGLVKLESEYVYPAGTDAEANPAKIGWVAVLNNVIYLSKDEYSAMLVDMKASDAPTDNAGDNAEAGFQVFGVQGGVIIQGAANQAVLIQNVLGQTIANKTIGSDYETISAGAGFVFVTINGETVKALVK